jgi:TRAP-type uncharacterized transport system substrate-binding protein
MKYLVHMIVGCITLTILPLSAVPQITRSVPAPSGSDSWVLPNRDQINEGAVTIITAPIGGTAPLIGAELATVLDDRDRLRILPIIGQGFVQNVLDVLYLKSVDMAIVVSDVLELYKSKYKIPNIETRLRYIAKLYNSEITIVAPTSIKSVYDLAGKRIMAPKDVGYFAAEAILKRLNIEAEVDYRSDPFVALHKVLNGEADAWFVSAGKVQTLTRNIKNPDRRFHLVTIPFDPRLMDIYFPSKFTSEEYPNLVSEGETTETVAASVLLVSFNWPDNTERYKRVARFVDAFFTKFDDFYKPPWSPKWHEASITANIPGWIRFKAAQEWLDRNGKKSVDQEASEDFRQFLAQKGLAQHINMPSDEMIKLFNEFVQWNRNRH